MRYVAYHAATQGVQDHLWENANYEFFLLPGLLFQATAIRRSRNHDHTYRESKKLDLWVLVCNAFLEWFHHILWFPMNAIIIIMKMLVMQVIVRNEDVRKFTWQEWLRLFSVRTWQETDSKNIFFWTLEACRALQTVVWYYCMTVSNSGIHSRMYPEFIAQLRKKQLQTMNCRTLVDSKF
jgi:hypothetical protein